MLHSKKEVTIIGTTIRPVEGEQRSGHVGAPPRPSALARRYTALLGLAAAVAVSDQAVKAIVTAKLKGGAVVSVLGGIVQLDYTSNTGGAFSILRGGGVLFAAVAVVVCLGIVLTYRRIAHTSLWVRSAIGLIMGGALGNLVDRIRLGYVVDFIDLRWWPVFNLADSAVVLGVSVLAFHVWHDASKHERADRVQGDGSGSR